MRNRKTTLFFFLLTLLAVGTLQAQKTSYQFAFRKAKSFKGAIVIDSTSLYTPEIGYGYDMTPPPAKKKNAFCFSVNVPDGDYLVTLTLGDGKKDGCTTVRAESRRLFIENLVTKAGKRTTQQFLIHKRSPRISDTEQVKIKPREQGKLDWDDKLTFEINGSAPQLLALFIEPAPAHTTLFLCGNSTVVNQDQEPWGSWGQMIPRFFNQKVCIANYGESGESATSFIAGNRQKKVLSLLKPGDYVFVEFGHNDEKIKGEGKGPYTSFTQDMRTFITETKKRGGIPVLLTPTERRSVNAEGVLQPTHGDYPDATRKLAKEEGVALIDLTAMTQTLYNALGAEGSKQALVHYPANTFPGQDKPLADNTHFNPYGAYEIAKCVLQGIRDNKLKVAGNIKDFKSFDPAKPDAVSSFVWAPSPFLDLEKPEGN